MNKYFKLILILSFWLVNAALTFGCVCDTQTFAEAFKESGAVFSGKFTGAEYRKGILNELLEIPSNTGEVNKEYEILVLKFQVEQQWKGTLQKEITLVTDQARFSDGSTSVSDCDLSFEVGKDYLIYAYGDQNELQTSACSRTAKLKTAKKDLKLLGKGKKPVV